jgi:acetyl-CoA carboxylase carboxyl transferase subunit alpha
MLENAIYSVISPEGCAAILWRDKSKSPDAATGLRLVAKDLFELGVIDQVIDEPGGGAHTDYDESSRLLDKALQENLKVISSYTSVERLALRYNKLREFGKWGSLITA